MAAIQNTELYLHNIQDFAMIARNRLPAWKLLIGIDIDRIDQQFGYVINGETIFNNAHFGSIVNVRMIDKRRNGNSEIFVFVRYSSLCSFNISYSIQ
jgi:hypothetical protein